ncbi:hypothetical protein QFW82_12505 [Streptomyces malaysiensis subsp. malaysiensis]|uniref:hypothetical protein n=1 Tax=Streptomyces TaxID=1883 RepID=UPI001E2B14F1|nr:MULTISPECIES: hypothetical protein [unclassified Streptomyces]MCD9590630.1 hypothetical protein [Streptomyces sp. 8ZJF_21]WHX17810.1 hypothetical protein QFW82_12505 [Streptomyces sp. NA07423]
MRRVHDPGADPEDEGMPDLQDGTPEQQRAGDPEQLPVAGDEPTIAVYRDTTSAETHEREPLEERLADEEPETGEPVGTEAEPAGLLYAEPDPDLPREQDIYSQEGSTSGLSAEEEAVRIKSDELRDVDDLYDLYEDEEFADEEPTEDPGPPS